MDSSSPKITTTVLDVPDKQENLAGQSETPLTTISEVFGESEALRQESESRELTAQIHRDRERASGKSKSSNDLPKQKSRNRHRHQLPTRKKVQTSTAPSSASDTLARQWLHVAPTYSYPAPPPLPPHHQQQHHHHQPFLPPQHNAVFQFDPQLNRHNAPYFNPEPIYINPLMQIMNTRVPLPNQDTRNISTTHHHHKMTPSTVDKEYEKSRGAFFSNLPGPSAAKSTSGIHHKMTESMLENEYDKSRGAFFSKPPPPPQRQQGMRIGKPNRGLATVARNEITSMKAEIAEVQSTVDRIVNQNEGKGEEQGGAGGEKERGEALGMTMEWRLRDVEERMGRMEKKLDRVLELLEGVPGPVMASGGGVEGWWKEVKEEM